MRHLLTILFGSWSVLCSSLATAPTKGVGECKTKLSVDGIQGDVLHDLCSLTSSPRVSLVLTCKDQESLKCLQPIDPIVLDVCQEHQPSRIVAIWMSKSKQHGGSLSVELSLVIQDGDVAKVLDVFQVHSSLQSTSEGVTRLEAIGRDRQTRIQIALHRTCISPSMVVLDRYRRENKQGTGPVQISITDRLQGDSAREESIFSGEGEQGPQSLDELVKDSLHRLQELMNSVPSSLATASDTPGATSVQTETATQTTTPSPTLTSTEYITTSKPQTVSKPSTITTSQITETSSISTVSATVKKSSADVKSNIEPKTDENTRPLPVENEEFKWAADEEEPRVIKQINDQDFLDQLLDSLRDGTNVNPVRGSPAPLAFSKPHVPVLTTSLSTATPVPPPAPRTTRITSTVKTPSARVVKFNPWSKISKLTNSTDGSSSDDNTNSNIGVGDEDALNPLIGLPTGKSRGNADDATTGSVTLPRSRPASTSTPVLTSSGSQVSFRSPKIDSTSTPETTDVFVPNNPPVAGVTKHAPTSDISSRIIPDLNTSSTTSSTSETVSPVNTDIKLRDLTLKGATTGSGANGNDDIGSRTTTDKNEDTTTTQTPMSSTSTATTSTTPTATTITTEASSSTTTTTPTTTTITKEVSSSTTTTTTAVPTEVSTSTTTTTKPTTTVLTSETTRAKKSTTATTRRTETRSTARTTDKSSSNRVPHSSTPFTTFITTNTTTVKTTPALKVTQTVTPVDNSSSTSTNSSASTSPVITTPDLPSGHTPGPLLATSSDTKAGGHPVSLSGDPENDDTFWPIVAAMVIGIPSIIVFGIAITVIHKRRLGHPTRFRSPSMYPSL